MIKMQNLSKSYGNKVLFQDISYHFPVGKRLALVGSNGAGKSTLLSLITGQLEADHGQVIIPKNLEIGFLPQEPNPDPKHTVLEEAMHGPGKLQRLKLEYETALSQMTHAWSPEAQKKLDDKELAWIRAGGPGLEANAKAVLKGLGFSHEFMGKQPKSLSGGWRMRLELAKIFINEPDFLILDEPTNHLDLPSLIWVENWLVNFPGTLLFVSHDRELLNRLGQVTLHLAARTLTPYAGNFDYFLDLREKRLEQNSRAAENLRKRRESLEEFVNKYGAKASKAAQARSKSKLIGRLKDLEDEFENPDEELTVGFHFPMAPNSGREILRVEKLSIGYDRVLASDIGFLMEKNQKIAIIGTNGIGKSTLLKTLAQRLAAISGQFHYGLHVIPSYFAQDQLEMFNPDQTVLSNILAQADADFGEKDLRSILGAFLFRGEEVKKAFKVLSGGEKSRLGLASLLTKKSNLLLLDEPTNHLDMASATMLSQALDQYSGSALFVSHDREFINSVATHIFVMLPDGRSRLFAGNLSDYESLAELQGFPNVLQLESDKPSHMAQGIERSTGKDDHEKRQLEKRDRQKKERELKKIELDLESAQQEQAHLEHLMAQDPIPSELAKFHQRFQDLSTKIMKLEESWLLASEDQ